jgi:hypothetical protein
MHPLTHRRFLAALAAAALLLSACAVAEEDLAGAGGALDNDPPLSSADDLLAGAPKADDLPREYKADEILPAEFSDLVDVQSPVRNQAQRGTCSIFSTIALMEHLYILEGSISAPDFSEQYLQWSVKFEMNSFPGTSGSSEIVNLRTINQNGIVAETMWPYEPTQWGPANDPKCTGTDPMPNHCYTNGHPTDAVRAANKFFLPRSRFVHPRDAKAHMFSKRHAVIASMDFFYQSWNHRKSELPTNADYWREGIVLFPNAKDREVSLAKRAGHSILLVGWDDTMEVQTVDATGKLVVDAAGKPVMEKGFYLFKNSWGTSSFGLDNPHGPGYGWISMR